MVGSRFLVRPLYLPSGDLARLVGAQMGVSLSEAFNAMRRGQGMDDLLEMLDMARRRHELTLGRVILPNGVVFEQVEINTPEDQKRLDEMMAVSGVKPAPKKRMKEKAFLTWMNTHLDDMRVAKRADKTLTESKHCLALFNALVGNKQVDEITTANCRAFFKEMMFWPVNATKRPEYRDLSVADILKKSKEVGEPSPSQSTINKHWQRLSRFFNFLIENEALVRNPLKGVTKPVVDDDELTRRPFTQEELDKLFNPPVYRDWAKSHPHRWWVPQLGLYTGARITELCQLYVEDVEVVLGIAGIHINDRYAGQKLKNKVSTRFVPLPKALLEAGFMTYVEDVKRAKHARLFPHLPNNDGTGFGKQMSRRFSTYVRDRGVDQIGLSFHAFRHTMATRLDRAGAHVGSIARITGHTVEGGVLPKVYIDSPTLPMRLETISKFNAGVTLPTYQKGQFDVPLKEAHDLPAIWAAAKKKRDKKVKGK
jgi:Site-specific recombinase XerD